MDWILQNKDVPLLGFSTREDEFGDVEAQEKAWLSPLRPIGYTSLLGFLEGRRAPKHRKHIEQLLEQYGCRTLEGFLQVSHALPSTTPFGSNRLIVPCAGRMFRCIRMISTKSLLKPR